MRHLLARLWAQIDGVSGVLSARNWRGAKFDRHGNQRPRVKRSLRPGSSRETYGKTLGAEFAANARLRRQVRRERRTRVVGP